MNDTCNEVNIRLSGAGPTSSPSPKKVWASCATMAHYELKLVTHRSRTEPCLWPASNSHRTKCSETQDRSRALGLHHQAQVPARCGRWAEVVLVPACPFPATHPAWPGVVKPDRGPLNACKALWAGEDMSVLSQTSWLCAPCPALSPPPHLREPSSEAGPRYTLTSHHTKTHTRYSDTHTLKDT